MKLDMPQIKAVARLIYNKKYREYNTEKTKLEKEKLKLVEEDTEKYYKIFEGLPKFLKDCYSKDSLKSNFRYYGKYDIQFPNPPSEEDIKNEVILGCIDSDSLEELKKKFGI